MEQFAHPYNDEWKWRWEDWLFPARCIKCLCCGPGLHGSSSVGKGRGRSGESCDQTSREKPHQVHNQDPPSPLLQTSPIMKKEEKSFHAVFCLKWQTGVIVVYPAPISSPLREESSDNKRSSCVILKSIYFRTWFHFLHLRECHFDRHWKKRDVKYTSCIIL